MVDLFSKAGSCRSRTRPHWPPARRSASSSAPASAGSLPRSRTPSRSPYSADSAFPAIHGGRPSGQLVLGTIGSVSVAVMQGASAYIRRLHHGAGHLPHPRPLGLLGCRKLIVTNAAGGIRSNIPQGSLVAISDHINLHRNQRRDGPATTRAFASCAKCRPALLNDMSHQPTLPALRKLAHAEAEPPGHPTQRRRLASPSSAPRFETPAEIRARRTPSAPTSSACLPCTESHRRPPHGPRSPRHLAELTNMSLRNYS